MLAERRQDPVATAEAHMYLGICAAFAREREEAARLLQEARRRWETLGDAAVFGQTLFYLGVAADATGDVAAAAAHYMAALEHLAAAGDAQYAGMVHSYLGVAEGRRGELPSAVAHIQAAVRSSVALCDRAVLSFAAQAAAALVAARVAPTCGARLLGATDALARATGATQTWERMLGGQDVAGLRERLARGEGELATAYREGRTLPVGDVAALALRLLEELAQALDQPEAAPAGVPTSAEQPPRRVERNLLSAREAEVLRLVAQGHSSKEIGRRLSLSASTVNQHVTSVFHKLGADTRAQAVAVAV